MVATYLLKKNMAGETDMDDSFYFKTNQEDLLKRSMSLMNGLFRMKKEQNVILVKELIFPVYPNVKLLGEERKQRFFL